MSRTMWRRCVNWCCRAPAMQRCLALNYERGRSLRETVRQREDDISTGSRFHDKKVRDDSRIVAGDQSRPCPLFRRGSWQQGGVTAHPSRPEVKGDALPALPIPRFMFDRGKRNTITPKDVPPEMNERTHLLAGLRILSTVSIDLANFSFLINQMRIRPSLHGNAPLHHLRRVSGISPHGLKRITTSSSSPITICLIWGALFIR